MRRNARGVFRTYADRMRTPSTLCALCRLQSHPYECSRAYKAKCDWEGIADLCLTKVAKGATVKPPFGATRLSSSAAPNAEFFKLVCGLPIFNSTAKLASLFCGSCPLREALLHFVRSYSTRPRKNRLRSFFSGGQGSSGCLASV